MTNETPDAHTHNKVSADNVSAVVQAGVINGSVIMRQESASPLLAYLEAGAALDSGSPIRETSAMATLVILLSANNEMFSAVVQLVRTWCSNVEPTPQRLEAAARLTLAGMMYASVDPDLPRQQLLGELLATFMSFKGKTKGPVQGHYRLVSVIDDREISPARLTIQLGMEILIGSDEAEA
jgi:hypothetical protein